MMLVIAQMQKNNPVTIFQILEFLYYNYLKYDRFQTFNKLKKKENLFRKFTVKGIFHTDQLNDRDTWADFPRAVWAAVGYKSNTF